MKKTIVMKKYFLHLAVALLAGAGLATSCSDSDDGNPSANPIFPEAKTATVLAGDSYTLDIESNVDWEVKIPNESAEWFWILDGSQKTYSVHGKAFEKATVTIEVSEVVEFDTEHSCDVQMIAAGETKTIATLTIGTAKRTLALYAGKLDEEGNFLYSEEGDLRYIYEEEPTETIDLTWPAGLSGYMYPIMVEANFAWRLAEKPEWIKEMNIAGNGGEKTEIRLEADPTKYPLDGDKAGKLVLCAANNSDMKYTFTVTIPACRDHFAVTGFANPSRFNAQGQFYNASNSSWVNGGMFGYITSVEEPVIYKFAEVSEYGGNSYLDADQASWIKIESTLSDDEENVLKEHRYTITIDENTGAEARNGVILALPKSVAATITDPYQLAGTDIEEGYQQYIVTKINQSAATSGELVEFYEDLGPEMAAYYSLSKLPKNTFPYEDKWASVPVIYNLTYTTEMAGDMAELKFNVEYDSYEVYNEEGPYAQSELSPRWVDLADGYNGKNCKLVKISCSYDNKTGTFNWTYGKPENPEAYFVFKKDGEIIGIIQFRFEEKQQGGGNEVSLAEPADGVSLVQLTSSDKEFDIEMDCPQYKLTFANSSVRQVSLNLPDVRRDVLHR